MYFSRGDLIVVRAVLAHAVGGKPLAGVLVEHARALLVRVEAALEAMGVGASDRV